LQGIGKGRLFSGTWYESPAAQVAARGGVTTVTHLARLLGDRHGGAADDVILPIRRMLYAGTR
jgi:hypothetical protein